MRRGGVSTRRAADAAGLVAGFALDVVLGDPRRFHPVAGFGRAAGALERPLYAPTRTAGMGYTALAVGVPVAVAAAASFATRHRPLARAALVAVTTWSVLGGRSLHREASAMAVALDAANGTAAAGRRGKRPHGLRHARSGSVAPTGSLTQRVLRLRQQVDRSAAVWVNPGGAQAAQSSTARAAGLAAARARLPHLCGRDPSTLDSPELARATVESVAENTSDAVVAPLFWGGIAGLPGLVGYRAVNTLDAMVGHRSSRYTRFGTAAARLDDAANLVPSRLTALLTAALAPTVAGDRARALRIWRRDGRDHPSPNAGQCESAMAGALGVRLGGRNVYSGRVEVRPFLGDGRRPEPADIRRAARLSAAVGTAGLVIAATIAMARRQAR